MRLLFILAVISGLLAFAFETSLTPELATPSVSLVERETMAEGAIAQSTYNDLVHYFRYATSAYAPRNTCTRPNGNTFVGQLWNPLTTTQGYVARDDTRKEIVVAFRGTDGLVDVAVDLQFALVQLFLSIYRPPGTSPPLTAFAHFGFTVSWNGVANDTIRAVRDQLRTHSDYTIITTGHSLGGALASLAGITLKENFPRSRLRVYSYGAPRVGNVGFAAWVNNQIGVNNLFRSVHTRDIVPNIPPIAAGYWHHATEYWQNPDPPSAANTRRCSVLALGEDITCSSGFLPHTIPPHSTYYGISTNQTFCR